jgi:hypothetical protein
MKYLIIGDVHGNYTDFARAVQYATENNLHLISVGDLVDNGPDGALVVGDMLSLLKQGSATLVRGNHEYKIQRWINGANVTITPPNQITVDQMTVDRQFKDDFVEMMQYAKPYDQLTESIFIAHAALLPKFWNTAPDQMSKRDVELMMFGQTDTSEICHYRGETYPIRIYDWVEDVPDGVTLFVGHDPRPFIGRPDFAHFQLAPTSKMNVQGGTTVFLDCGSGKGGTLWGAIVNTNNSIDRFINFSTL